MKPKRLLAASHPAAQPVYVTCPVCGKTNVRVRGLRQEDGGFGQQLELHYLPGTAEECTNKDLSK